MSEPIRVLHVDDDGEFAGMAAELLARQDDRLSVATATGAREGLEHLAEATVDCVVSDYEMPGRNGIEFLEAVREDHPELPFILFTGKGSEEVASEAIAAGVTDYLQKEAGTDQYAVLANRVTNAVDRRRTERAFEAARRRTALALEATDSVVFEIDVDSGAVSRHGPVEALYGVPSEAVATCERFYERCVHPEDRDRVERLERAENLPDSGEAIEFEFRTHPDEGAVRRIRTEAHVRDEDGATTVIGTSTDVTERAERAAEIDWHRSVLDGMREGVYVLDAEHTFRFVRYRADLADLSPEDWVGRPVSHLAETGELSAAEVDWIREGVDRVLAGEADEVDIEIEPRRPEAVGTVELRLTPLSTAGGDLVLATTRDVTKRKRQERELRRLKQEYETVFEHAEDSLFLVEVDRSGGEPTFPIRRVNPANEAALGLSEAAARGRTHPELFGEELGAEMAANYRRCLEAGETIGYEEEVPVDGEIRAFETTLSPVEVDGEITRVVGVAHDVTHRRERERELERQNERLEEFASVVSHDLRNPLNVAQGRLQLIADEYDGEHVEPAATALERCQALVEDLLTLAREGDRVAEVEPVELPAVVRSCWRNVATGEASLEVATERTVRADPGRLRQLLENLVRNAVEHASPAVTVTVGDLPEGFYLEDDGPGIPPAERERAFEAGYSTAEDGTGFGLNIVREVAQAHGWTVRVADGEAGGARFEITGVEAG